MSEHSGSLVWKIDDYWRVFYVGKGETLTSVKFSGDGDDLDWRLEHTVKVCEITGNDIVSFKIAPHCYADIEKYESVSGNVKLCIMNFDTARWFTVETSFVFKYSDDYEQLELCGTLPGIEYDKIHPYLCGGEELVVRCELTYHKNNFNDEIVAMSSSNNSNFVKMSESRLLSDIGKCFNEDRFKDVTISVRGKEYRAHKTILATRSTVFDRMLSVDMLESKKNHIDITDMDQETFEEMLHYVYTGKVKNLDESAFELLPVADKYDLEELRIMCEEVLLKKLSPDNAVKILILADMHRAKKLKAGCLLFIKKNYANCKDFIDKEWKKLTSDHDHLLKDMMDVFCNF
ncbi:speckle-type POZ protein-like [Planococcus citri]|uniref:speckle-type POZ protein-like n=1 Tax=Planococcus citri TaxID=170843 RepID=UPI0031F7BE5E